jgi:hypothetical protein
MAAPDAAAGGTIRRLLILVGGFAIALVAAFALVTLTERDEAEAAGLPELLAPVTDAARPVLEPVTGAGPTAPTTPPVTNPVRTSTAVPVVDTVTPVVDEVVAPVTETVRPIVDTVTPVVDEVVAPVTETATPIVDGVTPIITPAVDTVTPVVDTVVTPVLDTVAPPVLDTVTPVLDTVVPPIVDTVVPPVLDTVVPPVLGPITVPGTTPATDAPHVDQPAAPAPIATPLTDPTPLAPAPAVPTATASLEAAAWSPTQTGSPAFHSTAPVLPTSSSPTQERAPLDPAPLSTSSGSSALVQSLRDAGSSVLLAAFLAAIGFALARSWRLIVSDRLVRLPIVFSTVARPG